MSRRKPIPTKMPIVAGMTDHFPISSHISIEGIIKDHTEAATITPDAKPNKDFRSKADISFFMTKTNADPMIVPKNGTNKPTTTGFISLDNVKQR